ncbi:MAG: DnaJ C-terminal domain-containing protein [Verrucomicrobiaceae bacterium]
MNYRDYYEILGIKKDATHDEVRKAFKKLARKYHPDVAEDKDTAEDKFKEINEAYEVLGDQEKRKKYDTLGPDWQNAGHARPQQDASGYEYEYTGTGFSDFFEQMFGAGARPGPGSFHSYSGHPGGNAPIPGQDAHADILVRLEEVLNGTERSLQLQQVNRATGARELKTSRIRIPKGISEGQLIRCAGLGNPGLNGGPAGDLFLHVRLERHPDFRVVGSDLYTDLSVLPWQAVLGAELPVKTMNGSIRIKVPPLTEGGTELRIKGKGLPRGTSGTVGNLYAVVHLTLPASLTDEQKTHWQKLAELSSQS